MSKHLRKKKFVDPNVQGMLIKNVVRYWAVSIAAAGGLTVIGWIFITPGLSGFIGPNAFMASIVPMILVGLGAAILVLPVLLYDLVRVSHRFAGPLVRFKRHLREAADGGPMNRLNFRGEDFWPELAEAYNDLIDRVERERAVFKAEMLDRVIQQEGVPKKDLTQCAPAPVLADATDIASVAVNEPTASS